MQCKHHGSTRHNPQNCQRFWLRGPTTDRRSLSRHAAALLPFTVCMPNVEGQGEANSFGRLKRKKLFLSPPHTPQPPAQTPSSGHLTQTPTHPHTPPHTSTTHTTTPQHSSPLQSERQQETQVQTERTTRAARRRRSSVPPRSWGPLQEPRCCMEPPARTCDAVSTSPLQGRQVAPGAVKLTSTERVRQAHEGKGPKTKKTRATAQHRHPSPLIPSPPPPCPVATFQPRRRPASPQNRRTATLHKPDLSTHSSRMPSTLYTQERSLRISHASPDRRTASHTPARESLTSVHHPHKKSRYWSRVIRRSAKFLLLLEYARGTLSTTLKRHTRRTRVSLRGEVGGVQLAQ